MQFSARPCLRLWGLGAKSLHLPVHLSAVMLVEIHGLPPPIPVTPPDFAPGAGYVQVPGNLKDKKCVFGGPKKVYCLECLQKEEGRKRSEESGGHTRAL